MKGKTAVVVTTTNRGVFFGYIAPDDRTKDPLDVSQCRNCIYWSKETKGFLGLSSTGPAKGSRVGPAAALVTLKGITSVSDASPEAVKAWESGQWD